MTADLNRIRAVTANYFFWQGLRWIPLGLVLLAVSLGLGGWFAIPRALTAWAFWPMLAVALWLSTSVLGGYYQRTFGQVRADEAQHVRRTTLKWLVVYPAALVSMLIDMKIGLPFLLSGIVWGVSIELYRRSTGGERDHYLVAAVILTLLGVAPLAGVGATGKEGVNLLIGVLGIVYIVGGLLDHRALLRILRPAKAH